MNINEQSVNVKKERHHKFHQIVHIFSLLFAWKSHHYRFGISMLDLIICGQCFKSNVSLFYFFYSLLCVLLFVKFYLGYHPDEVCAWVCVFVYIWKINKKILNDNNVIGMCQWMARYRFLSWYSDVYLIYKFIYIHFIHSHTAAHSFAADTTSH